MKKLLIVLVFLFSQISYSMVDPEAINVDIYGASEKDKQVIIVTYEGCVTKFVVPLKITEEQKKAMVEAAAAHYESGCKP